MLLCRRMYEGVSVKVSTIQLIPTRKKEIPGRKLPPSLPATWDLPFPSLFYFLSFLLDFLLLKTATPHKLSSISVHFFTVFSTSTATHCKEAAAAFLSGAFLFIGWIPLKSCFVFFWVIFYKNRFVNLLTCLGFCVGLWPYCLVFWNLSIFLLQISALVQRLRFHRKNNFFLVSVW